MAQYSKNHDDACLMHFCGVPVSAYPAYYLRPPTSHGSSLANKPVNINGVADRPEFACYAKEEEWGTPIQADVFFENSVAVPNLSRNMLIHFLM